MSITFDTVSVQASDGERISYHEMSDFDINMNNSNAGMWLIRLGLNVEEDSVGDMDPDAFAQRLNRWFMRADGCTGRDLIRFGQLLALAGFAQQEGRRVGWC